MAKYDVIVIGAGPAGLFAAINAAQRERKVLLLDKNAFPGKKLLITGKGRCNVTNNCNLDTLVSSVTKNQKFLYSAFRKTGPQYIMDFFESYGVPLKTERGARVFPQSDRSQDIRAALVRACREGGVEFRSGLVQDVLLSDGRVASVKLRSGDEIICEECESVVMACGGASYPQCGADGSAFSIVRSLGHTVTELKPSLSALKVKENVSELEGLSLRNVGFSAFLGDKRIYEDFGEMLFTKEGISGPVALSASAHMRSLPEREYTVQIDLKPALSAEKLDDRIVSDLLKYSRKDFANSLGDLLPKSLIPYIVGLSGVAPELKCNQITRVQRETLVRLLKKLTFTVCDFYPLSMAIVTSGGVDVREINPTTMGSKKIGGLYFAGEMIDVDAYTGGFNLQIAFSTGRLAGINA